MTSSPFKPNPRVTYHHGNLRRALLDAALTILTETNRWDFSLREVARQAGVSHNAPYAHFPDKRALLAAVGVEGYERLRSRMLEASSKIADPGRALNAIGKAYIAFGIENPAHYRLMFGQDLLVEGRLPADIFAAAEASRSVLRDAVRRGAADGSFSVDASNPASLAAAVLAAWSLAHGFTLLAIDGLAQLETTLAIDELVDLLATRFMLGLAGRDR